MTSTETTAPLRGSLGDAGRQRDQLDRLLALENGEPHKITVDRDPDLLEQLVDAGLVSWSDLGYGLTDRGRNMALNLRRLDEQTAAAEVTVQFDAVDDEDPAELTGIMPAEGTLPDAPTVGRHRVADTPRVPGWLMVALLTVLYAVDSLITRVGYHIARFVAKHQRGLAWLVVALPALAAGLVLGTTGVLWAVTR